ncbi:Gfo/Idh/MocA family protein [Leptospira vanthielii]|uniref:Gfo/Idh/MocA family oxidoreductase n=1 Tax=Leptospira vanthielii TaxID=293085 RepID=A0ABY2NST0_9LEPT|nr:Gfo/Idh/MocA family oxidoreductase [Leptospira vanthielii]TGM60690.1 gfo/Idh/MocA family oxidoreductase [Leptospira vanthielii]
MTRTVLIVGLGQIGMGYDSLLDSSEYILTHARACSVHPDFTLVGGVDASQKNREKFESLYSGNGYENVEAALAEQKPDLVIVSTPTETHLEVIEQITSYHTPKAILCEKPLAYNLEDAKKIVEICANRNIRLYVNYHRRSDPGVKNVAELFEKIDASEKFKGVCWYSKGIYNNGSHFIDLLTFWLGQLEKFEIIEKGRVWQDIDPEPDVFFYFKRGMIVFLAAREENFSHYTVEIINSQGRLRYDGGGKEIFWQSKVSDPVIPDYTVLDNQAEKISNQMNFAQYNVLEQLRLDMENKKASICNGADALNLLNILNELKIKL